MVSDFEETKIPFIIAFALEIQTFMTSGNYVYIIMHFLYQKAVAFYCLKALIIYPKYWDLNYSVQIGQENLHLKLSSVYVVC